MGDITVVTRGCEGWIAASVSRGCGDVTAQGYIALMGIVLHVLPRLRYTSICLSVRTPDYTRNLTRNSAIADKPHNALCNHCNGVADSKTRSSPYVLPHQIWSFYVKWCRHIGEPPKLGSAGFQPFEIGGVPAWSLHALPMWLTVLKLIVVGKTGSLAFRFSRSLKVVGTDTERLGNCYCLLTFHVCLSTLNSNIQPLGVLTQK